MANQAPKEHGRQAYVTGRCKCEEICRKAVRDYSRAYDRARGVKPQTSKPWTEEELNILKTSELSNLELTHILPNRTLAAITHKRTMIGAGLLQRGLRITRPGNRGKIRAVRVPLPELVRNNRIKNIKTGKVYRICGVHLEADPAYVWLDRVDTMFSKLLKANVDSLSEKYEGVAQNKNANVSSGDSEPPLLAS